MSNYFRCVLFFISRMGTMQFVYLFITWAKDILDKWSAWHLFFLPSFMIYSFTAVLFNFPIYNNTITWDNVLNPWKTGNKANRTNQNKYGHIWELTVRQATESMHKILHKCHKMKWQIFMKNIELD